MVEIDYNDAFDIVADDPDQMIELVCENWAEEVESYMGVKELKEALKIMEEYFDYIPEDVKEEVHLKLTELGY